jgi:tetratricopeptide (TPR) repeat protein
MNLNSTALRALFLVTALAPVGTSYSQMLRLPDGGVNLKRSSGTRIGVTDIEIKWNAPGVKGREGNIWGTPVAPYGFTVLGFGSEVESPWRAGANESTTISFSTDVRVNGKNLKAGTYGFFVALYADSSTLIFNSNTGGWGSYFYDKGTDVLRVGTRQQKDQKESRERLEYVFSNFTDHSVEVALEWERWRIPFAVEVDLSGTTLASIRTQLTGAMGFDPPSLEAAAAWCLQNKVNYEEALRWISVVVDPNLGRVNTFSARSTQAGLLLALGRKAEADPIMQQALENATVMEMHQYGRQLLAENKPKEALAVFEKNFKKNKGVWPTNVGMMRGYSANGDLKKALEHAKLALPQAPNEQAKQVVAQSIRTLEAGKGL